MDRLTSMGISNEAKLFLDAALILIANGPRLFTPAYFTICQSIELSTKAFLRASGYDEPALRRIGHDLIKGIMHAQRRSLEKYVTLTDIDANALGQINLYYRSKDLQYSKSGYKSYPAIQILTALAEKLWSGTREFCISKRALHEGENTEVHW